MGFKPIPAAVALALTLIIWFVIPVPQGVSPDAWHLLALFVGIIVSTLSTLFIQAPLYYQLRKGDADVKELDAEVAQHREESAEALA